VEDAGQIYGNDNFFFSVIIIAVSNVNTPTFLACYTELLCIVIFVN
jgi:hypothetical protein